MQAESSNSTPLLLQLLPLATRIYRALVSSLPSHGTIRSLEGLAKCEGWRFKMSRNNGKGSKLELRLNLSRVRGGPSTTPGGGGGGGGGSGSPRRLSSSSSSTASPPSSCVSSEGSPDAAGAPMVLAGCPRCMMYVMLSREDPKCPKCHSTVLLDFNDSDPRHHNAGKSKGKRG